MNILNFSLGQLQANCYFVIEDGECLIVDPADDAAFILEELQRRKLKLIGMVATHGHFDHILAAGEIQLALKTALGLSLPLYIHKDDQFLVDRLNETAKYFLGFDPNAIKPKQIEYIREGTFKINKFDCIIIETPGHTPGSTCLYFKQEKIIFTGDTLFKGTIGRYDFSYSKKADLKKSLLKLLKLPKDSVVYPGHGELTKISRELLAPTLIY